MPGLSEQKILEMALLCQMARAFVTLRAVTPVSSMGSSQFSHPLAELSMPGPPPPPATNIAHHLDAASPGHEEWHLHFSHSICISLVLEPGGMSYHLKTPFSVPFLAAADSCKEVISLTFILPQVRYLGVRWDAPALSHSSGSHVPGIWLTPGTDRKQLPHFIDAKTEAQRDCTAAQSATWNLRVGSSGLLISLKAFCCWREGAEFHSC